MNEKNKKLICPECNSPLEVESFYKYGEYIIGLCSCENCDADYEFKYSKENGYETIDKYSFI